MDYWYKLDALQEMARECTDEPNKLYLIARLAEHVEDEEMPEGFLQWIGEALNRQR